MAVAQPPASSARRIEVPASLPTSVSLGSQRPTRRITAKKPDTIRHASTVRPLSQKPTRQTHIASQTSPLLPAASAVDIRASEPHATDETALPGEQKASSEDVQSNTPVGRDTQPGIELAATQDTLPAPVPLAQVAVAPVLLHQEIPSYPEVARRRGIEGVVRLEAVLGYKGQIEEEIKILESIPLLDAVASDALKHWRFTPARDHQGRSVRVVLEVPFRFALKEKAGQL